MGVFAALDVSQEEKAICVVGQDGAIVAEAKVRPARMPLPTGWQSVPRSLIGWAWRPAPWRSGSGTR